MAGLERARRAARPLLLCGAARGGARSERGAPAAASSPRSALAPTLSAGVGDVDVDVDAGACAAAIGRSATWSPRRVAVGRARQAAEDGGLGVRECAGWRSGRDRRGARRAPSRDGGGSGLIGQAGECADGTGELLPTERYDRWSGEEVAERWAVLAEGWLTAERFLSVAGMKDADGKPLPALALAGRHRGGPPA